MINNLQEGFITTGIYRQSRPAFNTGVEIAEIRLANMRAIVKERGPKAVMDGLGMSRSQLSQIVGKNPTRNIGSPLARRIERGLRLPKGWMDQEQKPTTLGTVAQEDRAAYGLAKEIQEICATLPHGFCQHILRTVREIKDYVDALPEYIRKTVRPPEGDEYYEWALGLGKDMAKSRTKKKSDQKQS